MKEDGVLLSQFETEGSQEAFGEIVHRHLDLVYSVAMRQVAGDEHLAKDVCQEVFASLARKAANLKGRPVVSGWLYRAAKFEPCRAVRNEVLRRTREREAGMEYDFSESEKPVDWEQARPLLDEAIAALKESDRDAICLRFYENRRFKEIGENLNLSENAARMRVNRSLDKLRDLLKRKGIQSSAATLAVAIGGQATIAAPVGLAQAVSASAVAATGSGLLLSFFGIMNTTKIIGLGVVSIAAVGSVVYLAQREETPEQASEYQIVDTVSEAASEASPTQETVELDVSQENKSTVSVETEEERYERRMAELDRLKEEEAISELEYNLRQSIYTMKSRSIEKRTNRERGL